jgi:glutamate synthase (NADPH/NADH) large chain/glutamate synthase (ferredoxin)
MGDDTPTAVLSKKERLLETYFKQLFAQVTNPAIDPIREELVMSLRTLLGRQRNLFEETEEHGRLIELPSPILFNEELKWLRSLAASNPSFQTQTLEALFDADAGEEGLEQAVDRLCDEAVEAVKKGSTLIVLSDRGVNERKVPIPMLLAVGAVHHHLIREGLRMRVSLILETGMPREIHHFAVLLGYGANALNPYLVFEIVEDFLKKGEIKGFTVEKSFKNYKKAVEQGILKIMSKMGISTISSYRGAQIFEAIGLSRSLVERCFTGTPSRVGGIDFAPLARDMLSWHGRAFGTNAWDRLEQGGYYRYRQDGEYHAANPEVVKLLQIAAKSGEPEDYSRYAKSVNGRQPTCLRDLLEFHSDRKPVPVEEVESMTEIRKRFCTPGISHGALSRETHEALAIAMNRIGGKSNSGEGGEDPVRYKPRPNGDWPNSKIKQVASGRFGVTPEYLMSAQELEIKIAQGSKPGEGGQLPGHKVSVEIAAIRHATPGVTLISPPPHHDIYSIEDLAQLIYDLKMINPKAKVCVKLVAAAGVGTVAAGVAKAHADVIQISGCEGGTGASPLSSIKNAGSPWELGLSETQQVLVLNDLRERVILRTDGGLKTGRDIVIAGILGAEEFGFGTAALIAAGCCMIRACHLNTCPVGVATQNEKLRQKFTGTPEAIIHFFNGVANEVRAILANLGYHRFDEIIGRTDLLVEKKELPHEKAKTLDLNPILARVDPHGTKPRFHLRERNDWEGDKPLDLQILRDASEAVHGKKKIRLEYPIRNIHRTVGARVAGEIAKLHGDKGLEPGTLECVFTGTAGQSFGAFSINGLRLILIGQANDYVGKGMHGGEIIIRPPDHASFLSHANVILGNTVMYGATGGTLYAAGIAGERFCVRNSGADAVIEGGGSHMCEYMTGGTVVCLGEVGWNFGAGMTGGIAYVLDERDNFSERYNPQLVRILRLRGPEDVEVLKKMIAQHLEYTSSKKAKDILTRWEHYAPFFWHVEPVPSETKIRYEVVVNVNRDDEGHPIPTAELAKEVKGK